MSRKTPTPSLIAPTTSTSKLIVSSAHLISADSAEMSEFEFGLIVAGNAFHRWIIHCMAAAGLKDLTPLDVLVLMLGTNDAKARFSTTPEQIASGIAGLLDVATHDEYQTRHGGFKILLICPPPTCPATPVVVGPEVGRPRATSPAKLGPDRTAAGASGRVSARTSVISFNVPRSTPLEQSTTGTPAR